MSLFPGRVQRTVLSVILALIGATTASAGLIDPGLEIEWWVNGSYAGTLQPSGVYNAALRG